MSDCDAVEHLYTIADSKLAIHKPKINSFVFGFVLKTIRFHFISTELS